MEINKELIQQLLEQAAASPRLRQNYDLRTSLDDGGQRMLNAMMPGTEVALHRHPNSNENVLCLCGKLVEILYEEDMNLPIGDEGDDFGHGMDAQDITTGKRLKEVKRYELDPSVGNYGCVVPVGVWHTVQVIEPCVIYEAKDGKYGEDGTESW